MRLFQDIRSKRLLHAKGVLFLFVGLLAGGAILLESPRLKTLFLLLIAIWAFCRFYYYLFYVLEHYAGRKQKYAGIFDALQFLLSPKNRD
jgi:hypothetical protein